MHRAKAEFSEERKRWRGTEKGLKEGVRADQISGFIGLCVPHRTEKHSMYYQEEQLKGYGGVWFNAWLPDS